MESIAYGYVKASLFQFQTIFLDISVKTRSQDTVDIQQTAISTLVFTEDCYFLDTGVFQSNRDVVPEISLLFGNWRNPIERTIFFSLGNCFLVYY